MDRVWRNLIAFLGWTALSLFAAYLGLLLLREHVSAVRDAFMQTGAVGAVRLWGFERLLFQERKLAVGDVVAFALVVAVSVATWIVMIEVREVCGRLSDLRAYRARGDADSARWMLRSLGRQVAFVGLLVAFLATILSWENVLMAYAAVAAGGSDQPAVFTPATGGFGGWVWGGLTALLYSVLMLFARRTWIRWNQLADSLRAALPGGATNPPQGAADGR